MENPPPTAALTRTKKDDNLLTFKTPNDGYSQWPIAAFTMWPLSYSDLLHIT